MLADEAIELVVTGPADVLAFGTAAPVIEELFAATTRTTFRGRALAMPSTGPYCDLPSSPDRS
ncbi:hypothetical protein K1X22_05550 [Mycolicibacterium farcinogenes]|nr:hypothetical protein K1X22_05550 [Mycolicibacterium farcinogenes]SKQ79894.1 Uncharacterised protein [Mycobacteroides abscessus subsp. massiliense]